jgi:predicted nucleotidyltransferase
MAAQTGIKIPKKQLADLCQRWKIKELGVIGWVLSEAIEPDMDIDVLVQFFPDARWSLFDMVAVQEELKALLGRTVNLVELEGLRNPYRRKSILSNVEIVYGTPDA